MALKTILTEPNKILRRKSLPVKKINKEIQILMDDMLETMYAAPGIGLAAIQIGIAKRIIVLDIDQKEGKKNPMFFWGVSNKLTAAKSKRPKIRKYQCFFR